MPSPILLALGWWQKFTQEFFSHLMGILAVVVLAWLVRSLSRTSPIYAYPNNGIVYRYSKRKFEEAGSASIVAMTLGVFLLLCHYIVPPFFPKAVPPGGVDYTFWIGLGSALIGMTIIPYVNVMQQFAIVVTDNGLAFIPSVGSIRFLPWHRIKRISKSFWRESFYVATDGDDSFRITNHLEKGADLFEVILDRIGEDVLDSSAIKALRALKWRNESEV